MEDSLCLPLTPLFYNLTLVVVAIWIAPSQEVPIYAIAWGVFAAGCIQVLIQIWPLIKLGLLPRFQLNLKHPGVKRVMYLMVPGIIAGGVSQLNMLVDTVLASLLPTGSPSWLYVSDRLMQLPLGIFAIAIGTVILPKLSALHTTGSKDEFSKTLDWALKMILLVAVPAAVALMLLAEPILVTLFFYGDVMTARDMAMSSYSLRAYAVGLVAFMLIKVLAPGFFARQQPKKPVYVALFSMVLNGFLAWLLGFHLGYNHVGLALASSISAFFTITALLYLLRKENIYSFEKGWFLFSIRLICASLILYLTVGLINVDIEVWRNSYEIERFIRLLAILAASMAAYFITLWASGIRLKDLTN